MAVTNKFCAEIRQQVDSLLKQKGGKPVRIDLEIYVELEKFDRKVIEFRQLIRAKFPNNPVSDDGPLLKVLQPSNDLIIYIENKQQAYLQGFNSLVQKKIKEFQESLESILQKKERLDSTLFDFELSRLLAKIKEFKDHLGWDKSQTTFAWENFKIADDALDKMAMDITKQRPVKTQKPEFHVSDAAAATAHAKPITTPPSQTPRETPLPTAHPNVFTQADKINVAEIKAYLTKQNNLGVAAIVLENRKLGTGDESTTIPVLMVYVRRSELGATRNAKGVPYDLAPAMQFVFHEDNLHKNKSKGWCINTPDDVLLEYAKGNKIKTTADDVLKNVNNLIAYFNSKNMNIRPVTVNDPNVQAALSANIPPSPPNQPTPKNSSPHA